MNFPELINLSPITTVRVPEVPTSGEKQLSPLHALKKTQQKKKTCCCTIIAEHKLAHREKPRHSSDFEMPDKRRRQPADQRRGQQPER